MNLSSGFNFKIGNLTVSPSYLQAGIIVVLLFILVLTLAQMRRHFLHWSIKGAIFGVVLGFILALVLEGFLLVSGRTFLITVLGWKNAPKGIQEVLDMGRDKFQNVLGESTECPSQ